MQDNTAGSSTAVAEPKVEVVDIDPDMALEILNRNTHNRGLRERRLGLYAADMSAGDWTFNGDPIRIAVDGTLLDGQHRLEALIQAKVTLRFVVVSGLPPEAQESIDGGIPRKFHDALTLRGEVNAQGLAALTRKVANWEFLPDEAKPWRRDINRENFSNAQLFRVLDDHPELRDVVRDAFRVAVHGTLPQSIVGLAWWLFRAIDEDDADEFFERFADRQGLTRGMPIYELRRTLETMAKNSRTSPNQTYLLAITIKAWNAYREGREVNMLKWKMGGAKPEKFPTPV